MVQNDVSNKKVKLNRFFYIVFDFHLYLLFVNDKQMVRDQEILKMLKSGEREGMNRLFDRYYRPLVVFADAYLRDLQGAEDLVQEQMVKLWTKRAFSQVLEGALSSFLFTVVKHACINWLEKKRIPVHTLDLPHYRIAEEEAQVLDEQVVEAIRRALEKLPQRTRQVVECVILEERMYKEAAEVLGVSVNTIKTLLRQGIRELKKILKEYPEVIYFLMVWGAALERKAKG